MGSIDWDTELAQIEREFNRHHPNPATSQKSTPLPTSDRPAQGGGGYSAFAVWARLVLVVALAGSLAFWPYARDCGIGLYAFMGAGGMVVIGGIWVGACTWRSRMGFAHTLALVLMFAGIGAVGHQVLQRIGYARINPSDPPTWRCSAPGGQGLH
jgi:hypothetical protein